MIFNANATLTLTGNSPTGLAVSLSPAFSVKNATVGDYLHDVYQVNPGTVDASIGLGLITSGHHLYLACDGPLKVTVTQTTDRTYDVTSFLGLEGTFSALKLSNSGVNPVNVTILVAGDRNTPGGGPGIYSVK